MTANSDSGTPGSRIAKGFRLPRTGGVARIDELGQPFCVVDSSGERVTVFDGFLQHVWASGSLNSVRTMAYALLRWYRFVTYLGVAVEHATREEVRDLVTYMRTADNPQRVRGPGSRTAPAGTVNKRTGKRLLPRGYRPTTINHQLAVLSSFYDWRCDGGLSMVNPVPRPRVSRRQVGERAAKDTRDAPYGRTGRGYRQKVPKADPRNIPQEHLDELFKAITTRRDWAMLFVLLWSALRASELLSLTTDRCDRRGTRVHVQAKGLAGETREVPVPVVFFMFLDAYLDDLAVRGLTLRPDEPLWRKVNGSPDSLSYQSLRAWFRRLNDNLGLNYTIHDLRHTALRRMVNDTKNFTLVDVKRIAGHVSVETTQHYTEADIDTIVDKTQAHWAKPLPTPPDDDDLPQFSADTMRDLFGDRG